MTVDKRFLSAVAVLISSVVGVGIFGIPFAFAKAGFLTGLLFLGGLALVVLFLNLAYGEVILRTNRPHHLVGYAGLYLGTIWKRVTFFTFILSIYSALLAYMIVGGEFLSNILSVRFYFAAEDLSLVFFAAGVLALVAGLRTISFMDLIMVLFYLGVVTLLFLWGVGKIDWPNYTLFHRPFWFLPYGVLLFALTGSTVVLQREVLEGREHQLKKAIVWGTIIPVLIYFLFAFLVVGVSGEATSPEALSGLLPFLNQRVIIWGSLFGVVAMFASFVNLGRVLEETFQYDFRLKKFFSWSLSVLPPLVIFLAGVRNFINVISLAGAVAIGLQWIIFVFVYGKVKTLGHRLPEYSLSLPRFFWYAVLVVAVFGIVYNLAV